MNVKDVEIRGDKVIVIIETPEGDKEIELPAGLLTEFIKGLEVEN